jgi:hypothetical protein
MRNPTPIEIATARRVLATLTRGRKASPSDAILLRLWIGPRTKMPLAEIAAAIIEGKHSKLKTTG